MPNRKILFLMASVAVVLMLLAGALPAQSVGPSGQWRLISPTEYTAKPDANMHGVFLTNGGTSGKGSGSGWAVSDFGFIFFWDGFSWNQVGSGTDCQLDGVNFGGPLNPLSSVTSSSGWIVGGAVGPGAGGTCSAAKSAVSLYWGGTGWTPITVPSTSFPGATAEMLGVSQVKSASSSGDSVDAWGVGEENAGAAGAFWHFTGVPGSGSGWIEIDPGVATVPVQSVYMTHCSGSPCSGDDGIAVGNGGAIYRFVGGHWTPRASPVATPLNGVAMSSQTNGWAVGDLCKIIRTQDGDTWNGPISAASCTTQSLRSIVLLSSSEGWAVGTADASGATILHGTSLDSSPVWSRLPVNQIATLLSLNSVTLATSGGNLWAVGAAGVASFCQSNCGSQLSAIWSTTTSPNSIELRSVFMDSDSEGWAVGVADPSNNPTILRWDGSSSSWTRPISVTPSGSPTTLNGVYLSGGSNGWAVGSTAPTAPATLYWNGNSWNGVNVGPCACQLNGVFAISGSEAWAVGSGGPSAGFVLHSTSQGGQFSVASLALGTKALYSVYFTDSNSGWAVGGDGSLAPTIVHTTSDGGDSWPAVGNPAPLGVVLKSVFFQDSTHGWAAGTGSTILFWNGISWTTVSVLGVVNPININGIAVEGGTPATDGWAVGEDSSTNLPITIHYDGTSWTVVPLSPAINNKGALLGVSLRSSTNGLAVGQQAITFPLSLSYILHLDPPGGSPPPPPPPPPATTTTSTAVTSTSSAVTTTTAASSTTSVPITSTTQPAVTTSTSPQTSSQTSIATTTSAQTTAAQSSSIQTPVALPGIPGFPWESIIAGIVVGLTALAMIRRRRHNGA